MNEQIGHDSSTLRELNYSKSEHNININHH